MTQLVGYARVSTFDQNLDLQKEALKKAGCEKIFEDRTSGSKQERPGLKDVFDFLRKGDTLVVWKLDRLGRSLRNLLDIINTLQSKGVGFKSLQENLDTTISDGKVVSNVFSALAEFERDIIRERTQAGLKAARARGRKGGRPKVMDKRKLDMARAMLEDKNVSIHEICLTLKISRTTLYRSLKVNS